MVSKTPAKSTPAAKAKTPFSAKKSPGGKGNFASPALKAGKKTPLKSPAETEARTPSAPKAKTPAKLQVKTPTKPEVKSPAKPETSAQPEARTPAAKTPAKPKTPAKTPKLSQTPVAPKSPALVAKTEIKKVETKPVDETVDIWLKVVAPFETTMNDIREGVSGVFSLKLARKIKKNNQNKKIFLIRFQDEKEAKNALEQLKTKTGKVLNVSFKNHLAGKGAEKVYNKKKLYITACPREADDKDIQACFPGGTVTRPRSKRNRKGSFFVEFADEASATAALSKAKDIRVKNSPVIVTYTMEDKEPRPKAPKAPKEPKEKGPAAKKAKQNEGEVVEKPAVSKTGKSKPEKVVPGAKRKSVQPEPEPEPEADVEEEEEEDSDEEGSDVEDIFVNMEDSDGDEDEEGEEGEDEEDSDDEDLDIDDSGDDE